MHDRRGMNVLQSLWQRLSLGSELRKPFFTLLASLLDTAYPGETFIGKTVYLSHSLDKVPSY